MGQAVDAIQRKRVEEESQSITKEAAVTAYAAGDAVSNAADDGRFTFTFPDQQRSSHMLEQLQIHTSNATGSPDLALLLFRDNPPLKVDNAPATFTDAELANLSAVVQIPGTSFVQVGANHALAAINIEALGVKARAQLFGQLITTAAYTPISGEVFTAKLTVG